MEIENDYLAQIFDGDQLYVFQNEKETIEYKLDEQPIESSIVNEPKNEDKTVVVKENTIQKEVVILINGNLASQEKETLNKLLKAINIEEEQYEIIHEHPEQLKSIQHLKLFLSFHNQFVQSKDYAILKINKGNAIYAHDLSELNKDNSKKLMLWNLLKSIV